MAEPLQDVRPMFELRGRSYIVTGGAQGIGFAVTRAICEMGGNVAVMDVQSRPVDEKQFSSLSEKYGVKTVYLQTDVTKQDDLNASFERAIAAFGSIDGLVPAAGIAIDKPFVEQTWEEFTRIQDINVSIWLSACEQQAEANIRLVGKRHILHCSAPGQASVEGEEARQHGPASITVCAHRPARLQNGGIQCFQGWHSNANKGSCSGTGTSQHPGQFHFSRLRGLGHDEECARIEEQEGGRADVASSA